MNVLLANSTCKVGGVSTFLLSLRQELLTIGHGCELFFFEHGSMEPHLPAGATVTFGGLADLLRLVEQRRIDVVHANNVDWPTGISAVRRLGARLVLTAHKVREPAWTYGWNATNCDALVTVSTWIKNALQAFTDVPIQVVHNGIDTRRFRPNPSAAAPAPIVAWVGRGSAARKRLEAFAAIAPALRQAGLRIWVIDAQGPGEFARIHPDAAAVLHHAAERWAGAAFEDMPSIYHQIAGSGGCIVSTASMEGLPLTLLEAQASGCIVIGAAVDGVTECVEDGNTGVLYPFETPPRELATLVIETLADQESVRRRQGAAVRHVQEHFSLARMAERYASLYTAPRTSPVPLSHNRLRHSPILHWQAYVDERLGVGYAQYEASCVLSRGGDLPLAAAAARESFATAPTMYAHPRRLAHLLRYGLVRRRGMPRGFQVNAV
jgi:glycosyltransferase involved in cell wall biosynthesis